MVLSTYLYWYLLFWLFFCYTLVFFFNFSILLCLRGSMAFSLIGVKYALLPLLLLFLLLRLLLLLLLLLPMSFSTIFYYRCLSVLYASALLWCFDDYVCTSCMALLLFQYLYLYFLCGVLFWNHVENLCAKSACVPCYCWCLRVLEIFFSFMGMWVGLLGGSLPSFRPVIALVFLCLFWGFSCVLGLACLHGGWLSCLACLFMITSVWNIRFTSNLDRSKILWRDCCLFFLVPSSSFFGGCIWGVSFLGHQIYFKLGQK